MASSVQMYQNFVGEELTACSSIGGRGSCFCCLLQKRILKNVLQFIVI